MDLLERQTLTKVLKSFG